MVSDLVSIVIISEQVKLNPGNYCNTIVQAVDLSRVAAQLIHLTSLCPRKTVIHSASSSFTYDEPNRTEGRKRCFSINRICESSPWKFHSSVDKERTKPQQTNLIHFCFADVNVEISSVNKAPGNCGKHLLPNKDSMLLKLRTIACGFASRLCV